MQRRLRLRLTLHGVLAPEEPPAAPAPAPEQPPAAPAPNHPAVLAPEEPPAAPAPEQVRQLTEDALRSFDAQNERMETSARAPGTFRVDIEESDVGSLPGTAVTVPLSQVGFE